MDPPRNERSEGRGDARERKTQEWKKNGPVRRKMDWKPCTNKNELIFCLENTMSIGI